MVVDLLKNQTINLQKNNGSQLTLIRLGLTWKGGLDLDLSVLGVNEHNKARDSDYTFYGNLSDLHTNGTELLGDSRTGASVNTDSTAPDVETLLIDTTQIPSRIVKLLIVASVYQNQETLSSAIQPSVRLIDEQARLNDLKAAFTETIDDTFLVYRYDLEKSDAYTLCIGELTRGKHGWSFTAKATEYASAAAFLNTHGIEVE